MAALLGGNLGTVFTFQLTGIATEAYGWRVVFYGEAVVVLFITVLWIVLVAKTPQSHRFISVKEMEYIGKSLGSSVSKEKVTQHEHLFYQQIRANQKISVFFFLLAENTSIRENIQINSIYFTSHFTLW